MDYIRNFSQTVEQKLEKNLTRKEERKFPLTYINPAFKPAHSVTRGDVLARQNSPRQGRMSRVNHWLPSFKKTLHKGPASVLSHSDWQSRKTQRWPRTEEK